MAQHIPPQSLIEQWDIGGLELSLQNEFASSQALGRWLEEDEALDEEGLAARVLGQIEEEYGAKEGRWQEAGIDMRLVEKQIMLQILDQRWKEHLASMDQLRQGIHKGLCAEAAETRVQARVFRALSGFAAKHQVRRCPHAFTYAN